MLEIDEKMPFYICEYSECNSGFKCPVNSHGCYEDCKHTTSPFHAENPESVKIFEKFCDTFHVVVDDYGRLVCTEKEVEETDD